ncbi:MAG: hypothetical protein ABSG80_07935 [Verrucomicrobiota bacterium]|jgi:hypothetical protein
MPRLTALPCKNPGSSAYSGMAATRLYAVSIPPSPRLRRDKPWLKFPRLDVPRIRFI